MLRPALPNSPGGGTANALGLNQHDGVPTVDQEEKVKHPRANSPRPVHAAPKQEPSRCSSPTGRRSNCGRPGVLNCRKCQYSFAYFRLVRRGPKLTRETGYRIIPEQ